MKNFGQLWALVLATERSEREESSLLGYVVNRAARTAHRERVWAVVTQQHRRQLKGPLWFLPASNLIALPEPASTTFGIIMGLLRILQRDPAARVLVLPANHYVRNEKPLMRSLRPQPRKRSRGRMIFSFSVWSRMCTIRTSPASWSVATIAVAPSRWSS